MGRVIIQFGRSKLILGLIISIGFVVGYMNYLQQDDPAGTILINDPIINEKDWDSFRDFKMDFSILEDKRYRALQVYGENPVYPGTVGERSNIFAPIGR